MSPEPRAILFDLDDTLYPQRRFVFSGFATISRRLAETDGLDARAVFAVLRAAWRGPARGRELQVCVDRFGLRVDRVGELLDIMRAHRPVMRLPRGTSRTLLALRDTWRTGIITNGIPAMQARKVEALGVGALMDAVIFANEHGSGIGKPEAAPFAAALERLGVAPQHAVFVGNDEECDIVGAVNAGMKAILVRRATEIRRLGEGEMEHSVSPCLRGPSLAHAVVTRIAELPQVVAGITTS